MTTASSTMQGHSFDGTPHSGHPGWVTVTGFLRKVLCNVTHCEQEIRREQQQHGVCPAKCRFNCRTWLGRFQAAAGRRIRWVLSIYEKRYCICSLAYFFTNLVWITALDLHLIHIFLSAIYLHVETRSKAYIAVFKCSFKRNIYFQYLMDGIIWKNVPFRYKNYVV